MTSKYLRLFWPLTLSGEAGDLPSRHEEPCGRQQRALSGPGLSQARDDPPANSLFVSNLWIFLCSLYFSNYLSACAIIHRISFPAPEPFPNFYYGKADCVCIKVYKAGRTSIISIFPIVLVSNTSSVWVTSPFLKLKSCFYVGKGEECLNFKIWLVNNFLVSFTAALI